jgi:DNA (cytosine-5)-methyltransferase 1
VIEPYVMPAAAAIDWSDTGTRIGDRPRPLADKTMARIRAGLAMFAAPTVVNANHHDDRAYPAAAGPLASRTTKIGDGLACPPMLVPAGGTWNDTATPVDQPMRTRTVREAEGVLVPPPFLSVLRSGHPITIGTDRQLATLVANGSGHALVQPEPFVAMLRRNGAATSVADPIATLAASGNHHALVIPYRRGALPTTTGQPLHTLHTRGSAALVGAGVEVDDCHFRMLKPREHLRGQRFPDTYIVTGNKGEQTMQAGNAVSANVAQWLGQQLAAALDQRGAA